MNTSLELLYGLRWQIRKDHTAFKQFLFDEYLRKNPILQHLYSVFLTYKATWLGLLLCRVLFVYTYLSIRVPRKATVLTVLKIKTETTSFKEVIHRENYRRIDVVRQNGIFIPVNILQSLTRREANAFFKLSRIFSILTKRYPLFVVLRAVEYLVYYLKLSSCFANGTTQSVVVFSDGNPHGIALFHLSKYRKYKAYLMEKERG